MYRCRRACALVKPATSATASRSAADQVRPRPSRAATRTAFTIARADDEPWLMMQTPSTPSSMAPPVVSGSSSVGERQRGRAAARRRRLGSSVASSAPSTAPTRNRSAALEGLERDVAGEAVGDDDVDRVGHEVAALDVADERRRPRPPASRAWVSFTSGVPLVVLLADREQADPRARRRRSAGRRRTPRPSGRTARATRAGTRRWRRRRAARSGVEPGTGIGVAMAGRATPLIRPMRSRALAMVAPGVAGADHGRRPARRAPPRPPGRARSPSCGARPGRGRRPCR